MKNVSRWANRHVWLAVLTLIGCEIVNAFAGILLGASLLENFPVDQLLCLTFGVVGGVLFVHRQATASGHWMAYTIGRLWLFGAFMGNFLLFNLLGGFWSEAIRHPTANQVALGVRSCVMIADTLVKPDSVPTPQPDYYVGRNERGASTGGQAGKRIGFVLLFLLGMGLSFLSAGLACNLLCAGYGGAAMLILLLGIGAQGAGLFFLSRAFEKVIKPWREMGRPERKKVNTRFTLIWLGLWAFMAILSSLI